MYTLICDGQTIATTSAVKLAFESGTLLERVGAAPVLTCTLMPWNPYKDLVALRSSVLTLERSGTEIFRGQAVTKTVDGIGFFEISGLGDMSYLSDVMIAPFSYSGTLSDVMGQILTRYNTTASTWKRILKGTCGISGSISYELTSYRSAWDCISDLVQEYGGVLEMRWLPDGTRGLDWVEDTGRYSRQAAIWGDNLLSLEIENDAGNVVNTLICEGDDDLLYTASDAASQAKYGKICRYQRFNGIETAADLAAAGQAALGKLINESRSVSGHAVDRWTSREDDFSPFTVGSFVRTVSQKHLLDEWLVCSELRHDLTMAKPVQVTLGRIGDSLAAGARTAIINKWISGTRGSAPPRVMAKDRNGAYAKDRNGAYAVTEGEG